jgi:tetratricopeptide (TPR) repeat protein
MIENAAQVSELISRAAAHLERGEGSAAGRLLKQALEQAPNAALSRAFELWRGNQPRPAMRLFAEYSQQQPNDFRAHQARAHIASQAGIVDAAIEDFKQCLAIHPGILAIRPELANLLARRQRFSEALEQLDALLESEPKNRQYRWLKAALLDRAGQYHPAIEILQQLISEDEHQPNARASAESKVEQASNWTALGMMQRTVGDSAAATGSLSRATELDPSSGWPWFQLSDFKTIRFTQEQIAQLETGLERAQPGSMNQVHFDFALGRALESQGEFDRSFTHYHRGNRTRAALAPFDMSAYTHETATTKAMFSPGKLPTEQLQTKQAQQASSNIADDSAIFVVGLPRSGTTLVDQVITSHSRVDGTMELAIVSTLIRELQQRQLKAGRPVYPAAGVPLDQDELNNMAVAYLQRARIQRGGGDFFVDKMPFNFQHIGLIPRMLPGARIIDVRRDPMAMGFSIYRQLFRMGQDWAFDLQQIGRYYRIYLDLMNHWEQLMPGLIIRVQYEDLVSSPEHTIRKLLHQLNLDEEVACFKPHENTRPVRTASSEQVRKPLYTDAVAYWQNFEKHLAPLKAELDRI